GTGKTVLAKAIARSLGCSFRRIQFTPDLLPSDVTGVSIFNQRTSTFEFRPGPIMSQIVLADEINRATPKTQSALLESMEEHQVTVDGTTYQLPEPFLVMATQNPIEYEGTFPLPEAQLDRFFMRIQLGYATSREEIAILDAQRIIHPLETIDQVLSSEELLRAQSASREIHLAESVKQYVDDVVTATRSHPDEYRRASHRDVDPFAAHARGAFGEANPRAVLCTPRRHHRARVRAHERSFPREALARGLREVELA